MYLLIADGDFTIPGRVYWYAAFIVALVAARLLAGTINLSSDLRYRLQQWRQDRTDARNALDPRPPVIYLRSFRLDGTLSDENTAEIGQINKFGIGGNEITVHTHLYNEERWLVRKFERIGPVRALEPAENPVAGEFGATRIISANATWQLVFLTQISNAALILFRVKDGFGPNTAFELKMIKHDYLVKTVFYLDPYYSEEAYNATRRSFEFYGLAMPPMKGADGRQYLCFDDQHRGTLYYSPGDCPPYRKYLPDGWILATTKRLLDDLRQRAGKAKT